MFKPGSREQQQHQNNDDALLRLREHEQFENAFHFSA
jgi:hypothetical protein